MRNAGASSLWFIILFSAGNQMILSSSALLFFCFRMELITVSSFAHLVVGLVRATLAIIFTEVRALKIIKPEQVHVQQAERYLFISFISSFSFGQVIDRTLNSNKLKLTYHFSSFSPLCSTASICVFMFQKLFKSTSM